MLHAGDNLSFNVGKSAQESQSDNLTPEDRLEGLILCMGDFHTLMNQLDIIFEQLYDSQSGRSIGSFLFILTKYSQSITFFTSPYLMFKVH